MATFDTGLADSQRSLVHRGVVTLLSGLLRSSTPAGYLQAVIPFGGVIRSYQDDAGIGVLYGSLNGAAPAIAVAIGDRTTDPAGVGGFQFKSELELILYHAGNNQRDLAEGRLLADVVARGSGLADPGLWIQMEHAEELLVGQRVPGAGSSIKQIRPVREEELATFDNVTIWQQTYRVTLVRTIDENRDVTQLLTEIASTYRTSAAANQPPTGTPILTADITIPPPST